MNVSLSNRVILAALAAFLFFFVVITVFPLDAFIVLLNGVFIGAMASILVAYGRLIINAFLGVRPYDRVRQMTLGFFLCWLAYALTVISSIYFRSAAISINSTTLTAASKYMAIWAACLQVTAPDFGLGLFHGRERKTLWTGALVGLAVAAFMIYAQRAQILSDFDMPDTATFLQTFLLGGEAQAALYR